MVVYQIHPSNVVELQQHYLLCNNTSVITCFYRMIISPPCLFKHRKNDERVAMFFQCLLDHTQQKLYFCLILLLRNNVSKSVYINFRQSAWSIVNYTPGLRRLFQAGVSVHPIREKFSLYFVLLCFLICFLIKTTDNIWRSWMTAVYYFTIFTVSRCMYEYGFCVLQ